MGVEGADPPDPSDGAGVPNPLEDDANTVVTVWIRVIMGMGLGLWF